MKQTEDPFWQAAQQVCTKDQLQVLDLHHRVGLGARAIAKVLRISRSAVRDRQQAAEEKIARYLEGGT